MEEEALQKSCTLVPRSEGRRVLFGRLERVLEREGRAAGFTPAARRSVPPTEDYSGSEVVILRA